MCANHGCITWVQQQTRQQAQTKQQTKRHWVTRLLPFDDQIKGIHMVTIRTRTRKEFDLGSPKHKPSKSTSRTPRRLEDQNRVQQY